MNMNSFGYQNYNGSANIPLPQCQISQAMCNIVCDYETYSERYQKDTTEKHEKDTTEKYEKDTITRWPSSLLKNILLHGKQTVKPDYYTHPHANADMALQYQGAPNSQIISHNLYQNPLGYLTSPPEISPKECEQFFGNLQGQQQQQQHIEYYQNRPGTSSQRYPDHTVQSHNYAVFAGPSTMSTQYELDKPKQQVVFNAQQPQLDFYGNNNNNIRQRNKNIPKKNTKRSNCNYEQRAPHSNNVADYPWMYKRANGKSLFPYNIL